MALGIYSDRTTRSCNLSSSCGVIRNIFPLMKSRIVLPILSLFAVLIGVASAPAQPSGFDPSMFDPAMIQKRILEGYRAQLEVKDDAEWGIVEGRIQKVLDARRAATPRPNGMGGMAGMAAMFGGGGPGGPRRDSAGGPPREGPGGERQQRANSMINQFLPPPSPEEDALKKAVEAKASKEEIKAALAKVNESRKRKLAELEKARDALRELLTVQQEAIATLNGLL